MPSEKELLALVALSYAAATDPAQWSAFLDAVARAAQASRPILFLHPVDPSDAGHRSIVCARGYDEGVLEDYRQYYAARNIWLAQGRRLLRPGVARTSEMMCRREVLLASEFYNDFLRPNAVSHALAATLAVEEGVALNLSVFREPGDPQFSDEDLQFLQALLPHLEQAAAIRRRTEGLETRARWCEAALDRLSGAVVLVDRRGKVLFANESARRLLGSRDGLAIEREQLLAATPSLTAELRRLIARATGAGADGDPRSGGAMAVPRRGNPRPLDVVVAPLASSPPSMEARAAAALFLGDPSESPPSAHLGPALRCLYGLTPAEARVAELLVRGMSPHEIASACGTSLETVRTQVKQVLSKTDTRRQSQLVALLLRTTAASLTD